MVSTINKVMLVCYCSWNMCCKSSWLYFLVRRKYKCKFTHFCVKFLFKVGMHLFYVRLIAIWKIHEIFSILQHHCRCCGKTLCHEHSSNQMVRSPIPSIYIFGLTMPFSSCKSLDKSTLTKQSFIFSFLCAYSGFTTIWPTFVC